jgi:hypothetical protein
MKLRAKGHRYKGNGTQIEICATTAMAHRQECLCHSVQKHTDKIVCATKALIASEPWPALLEGIDDFQADSVLGRDR